MVWYDFNVLSRKAALTEKWLIEQLISFSTCSFSFAEYKLLSLTTIKYQLSPNSYAEAHDRWYSQSYANSHNRAGCTQTFYSRKVSKSQIRPCQQNTCEPYEHDKFSHSPNKHSLRPQLLLTWSCKLAGLQDTDKSRRHFIRGTNVPLETLIHHPNTHDRPSCVTPSLPILCFLSAWSAAASERASLTKKSLENFY